MDERYPGLTGAGLASLLAALPRLRLLIADPHLLKDAILFLHNVNVTSRTFPPAASVPPPDHQGLELSTKFCDIWRIADCLFEVPSSAFTLNIYLNI